VRAALPSFRGNGRIGRAVLSGFKVAGELLPEGEV
jgi:hypothetical protein